MPVKDLVQQFESSTSGSHGIHTPSRARQHSASPENSSTATSQPPPSPARFLQHPLLKRSSLPMPPSSGSLSPVTPLRHAKVAVGSENASVDGLLKAVKRDKPGAKHRRTTPPSQDGKWELELSDSTFPQTASSLPAGQPRRTSDHTTGICEVDNLERIQTSSSRSSDQISPSTRRSSVTDRPEGYRSTIPTAAKPSISCWSDDSSSVSPRLQVAVKNVDACLRTPTPSHVQGLPAPSSNQEMRIVGVTKGQTQTDVHSSPPTDYPSSPTNRSKIALRTSSHPRSPQINNIPLDMFSRSSHDTFSRPTNDTSSRPTDDHDNTMISRPLSPSSTLVSQYSSVPHVPIAAKTVFSRGSAPLSLPSLDNYLSSFPAPTFSSFPSHGKQSEETLFPPMDILAATGRTIEELEKNSVIRSWWRDRGSISSSLVNAMIGIMGSTAVASYYSLQGLYDSLQLFALLLSTLVPTAGNDISNKWRTILLGTIPNVLALNVVHTLVGSFIMLTVSIAVAGLLLYYFHLSTKRIALASSREGLQGKDTGAGWGVIFASFILTVIYLPLSTVSVHALLWSEDFWVVPNPYTNATTLPPSLPSLGPASEFRDPLDFCYTTTMSKNQINFAPLLVILAVLTFIFLTVWFPVRLAIVIKDAIPRVDSYTELGRLRSRIELNHEYERLLDRDDNPFSFLYRGLRMGWATYSSFYLFVKLSTLLIVAVLDSNNCLFRNANRNTISLARQGILVFAMSCFLVIQSVLAPFLDPVDNASEWVSRVGYITFAVLGLGVALNIPMGVKYALSGPVLYIVYFINYGFTFYFLLINLSWTRRLVKKLSRRIDFSIDIFSPHLDISSNSRHTRRRIWQESITVLLLGNHECAIPKTQKMEFSESQDSRWPPYLLNFQGTPGERHVENLKILREMGGFEYAKGVALYNGRHAERMTIVQEKIQRHFIGPDSYWRAPARYGTHSGCFGNAWWIPFPPTLVMRHDSGEQTVLNRLHDFEEYIRQNEDIVIQEKRSIRMALRALDGLIVTWPQTHTQPVGSRASCCWGRRYAAQTSVEYESCVFSIRRCGSLQWKNLELGSGFDVQLTYTRDVQVDGGVIGLSDDFDLTPPLARFMTLNRVLINDRLPQVESVMRGYRRQMRRNARAKCDTLTYDFLSTIYGSPKDPHHLSKALAAQEKDLRVRQTFAQCEDALRAANERMLAVGRSEASTWWYLYWDDLWRRNHDTIAALNTHAPDFNPHYSTSIAYRPLPRAALETFLSQRGLISKNGRFSDFIHSGILNKFYFRLNQIVFRGSDQAIAYHLGEDAFEVDLEDLDLLSHAKSSTLGTGGGTDHDDVSIRARPMYRWEAIFEDPLRRGIKGRYRRWLPKLAVWFGLSPFWKLSTALTSGISLDVRFEDGRYILLENVVDELKGRGV